VCDDKTFSDACRFAVLSLISAVVTIWFQYNRALQGYATLSGIGVRLALAGWTPWFYVWKTLVPIDLMVIYPQWKIDASQWASYLPGVILVGCVTLFWWKRDTWGRPFFFGVGYFVVMLLPVLGFFDLCFYYYSWVADHWQYYSIIGVIALTVAGGDMLRRRLSVRPRLLAAAATVVLLALLGIATWRRESVYASDVALWRDNLSRNPCVWAHNNLANSLIHVGKVQEALWHYEQALRIDADCAEAQIQLARLKARVR
jgi:protein O-mannosyl-transferase